MPATAALPVSATATEPGIDQSVLIPLKLDAFVFNGPVCDALPPAEKSDGGGQEFAADPSPPTAAKIAPVVQPNYTFLRLDSDYIQPDIQNPVDLNNTWPSQFNSRYTDLGTDKVRSNRRGVYLHWTIPRLYRSGVAAAGGDAANGTSMREARAARGLADGDKTKVDKTVPTFPKLPTRWLVIRYIHDMTTVVPAEARSAVKQFTAWVIESDRLRELEKIDVKTDLQIDVSPFISAEDGGVSVAKQAEVFIGNKEPIETWKERYKQPKGPGNQPKAKFLKNFSLLTSSNQLFADYQPHNSNVFSMLDNFQYAENKYLTAAKASYYIVGWHSEESDDIFVGPLRGDEALQRRKRLELLKLKIKMAKDKDSDKVFSDWLQSTMPTRIVCHGAMYQVNWNVNKKPDKVPADEHCTYLNRALPLAIGTTPLDALTTYARAFRKIDPPGSTPRQLEEWITKLEHHLLARDDGVEAQQQAKDLLYNWNYLRVDGGQNWHAAAMGENDQPLAPPEVLGNLRELNIRQELLDGVQRTTARLRWQLFAEWWRLVSDPDKRRPGSVDRVNALQQRIDALKLRQDDCERRIRALAGPAARDRKVEPGARPTFYQQRDPTLLVGGIRSGWQHDYLDDLLIRLESQTVGNPVQKPTAEDKDPVWDNFETVVAPKLPRKVLPAVRRLVSEFIALRPEAEKEPGLSDNQQMPLFHDQIAYQDEKNIELGPWRDRWDNTQPWFPLFLEWEVEYHHIPKDLWQLEQLRSRTLKSERLRYGIDSKTDLQATLKASPDRQVIEGRVLILPQPSFSLEAKIKQLFADTPSSILDKDGKTFPNKDDREKLTRELHKLAFLSAPLAGLTSYLTTVLQGNHIKPNLRDGSTGLVTPITDALRPEDGFKEKQIQAIDVQTDNTPFGTSIKPPSGEHPLFKPVTHGQFRFTRLNIIDKFGQAIHAIDPRPSLDPQRVWPCIGEWYAPQLLGDPARKIPNVVERPPGDQKVAKSIEIKEDDDREEQPKPCEFMQIPPQINQQARLNAVFVVRADEVSSVEAGQHTEAPPPPPSPSPFWRKADEWESPIWGWVVINYANSGIQLFLPDGTFYREVRLAGMTGAQTSPEWLPFRPPMQGDKHFDKPEMLQLQLLVQRLGNPSFLRPFWDMIERATGTLDTAPDTYAAFTNALIGRPLALANIGWSLELAADAMTTQVEMDKPQLIGLLPVEGQARYEFDIKLGDSQRGFDGLVGYFECRDKLALDEDKDLGLNLGSIWSDFAPPTPKGTESAPDAPPVAPSKLVSLNAYYQSPETTAVVDAVDYVRKHAAQLRVYGVLMDPFSPVHAYSGILPVRELSLPPWTWQAAMARMKAFFHAGPLVVTSSIPSFVPARELDPAVPVTLPDVQPKEGTVVLPAMASGNWAWLQPYYPTTPGTRASDGEPDNGEAPAQERFMPLPLSADDERARFEKGPYTAIEGYLMMVGPPKVKK